MTQKRSQKYLVVWKVSEANYKYLTNRTGDLNHHRNIFSLQLSPVYDLIKRKKTFKGDKHHLINQTWKIQVLFLWRQSCRFTEAAARPGRRLSLSALHWGQFWAPQYHKDLKLLENIQRRDTKMLKGPERMLNEEQLRSIGLFSWRKGD